MRQDIFKSINDDIRRREALLERVGLAGTSHKIKMERVNDLNISGIESNSAAKNNLSN